MGYFFIGEGIMLLSVFIVTFLMMRFLDRRPFSDLGFSLKGRGKDILYGFLMAVLIYAIGFGVCLLTGQIEVVSVHLHWSDLLLSGLFFAMVAIVEETMMRGYVLGRLLRTRLNKFISLLISSPFVCVASSDESQCGFFTHAQSGVGRFVTGSFLSLHP